MSLALSLYRWVMVGLSPFSAPLFYRRVRKGKEDVGKFYQRLARDLPPRPVGELIWMHGASLGESRLLLNLSRALLQRRPKVRFLFTSQTKSSADMIAANLPEGALHQMLPFDTPSAAQRFVTHWRPDLCLFAESEIWPNLIEAAARAGVPLGLLNARMRPKSLQTWRRFAKAGRAVFGQFSLILAADQTTATGLSALTGRKIEYVGDLKAAFVPQRHTETAYEKSSLGIFKEADFVLLAASTHPGEEAFVIEAFRQLDGEARLIIAPRHIDRADGICAELERADLSYTRFSSGGPSEASPRVLIADTYGQMNRFYALADCVYLGGAHCPGIGGHNPLEPIGFLKPTLTGPYTDNFTDLYAELGDLKGLAIVRDQTELIAQLNALCPVDAAGLETFIAKRRGQMEQCLDQVIGLLEQEGDL